MITISVADNSDQGGLKIGQTVRANGYPGLWTVVKVHDPILNLRSYDLEPLPSRHLRRKAAKTRKESV